MRKIKYMTYCLASLLLLQACSLLAHKAPDITYRPFESAKDYQAYKMTDLEKMLSSIFKEQGLTGKIQVTDVSANFPQNDGYTAYFVYTELVDGQLVAQSSMIDVSPDFTALYDSEDVPPKLLSPSELDDHPLFNFLIDSAWEAPQAKSLLDEAKATFSPLEELGLKDLSIDGSFVDDVSPRYYEKVAENQHTKAKRAFAGFYEIDMKEAMSSGDAKLVIHGLWQNDDETTSEQEDDLMENLIFRVQTMSLGNLPDGQYRLSYTHQARTTYYNGIYNGFDFEVKSGQLVNFYVEPMGPYSVDRQENQVVPSQELQDTIIKDFLSNYREVTSIEVIEAQAITTGTQDEVTLLTLKINGQFFIQYQYDYNKALNYGHGNKLGQYGNQMLVYELVKLDDPVLDQRLGAVEMRYLTTGDA